MTIPNSNYNIYRNFKKNTIEEDLNRSNVLNRISLILDRIENINKTMNKTINNKKKEDKSYCHKLQTALFYCREKNDLPNQRFHKCNELNEFIEKIGCYKPYE